MAVARAVESLVEAYGETLLALGSEDAKLTVLDAGRMPAGWSAPLRGKFPDRFHDVATSPTTMISRAAELASQGRIVFANDRALDAVGRSYGAIRDLICVPKANVKIVGTHAGLLGGEGDGARPMLEDLGLMRGLPSMTVVVPADAPTTAAAVRALGGMEGPAYLRLPDAPLPTVTEGQFRLGRAEELRPGADLTLVALGALVARALDVAEELHRVGIEARVLDFASLKPFDEKALLRAARETGAFLTLEEHSALTGLGALVASTTSENYPVPVRRLGVPDLFGESGEPWALLDRFGLSKERALEEAWELLKLRGRVN
jgi:transketolase